VEKKGCEAKCSDLGRRNAGVLRGKEVGGAASNRREEEEGRRVFGIMFHSLL